MKWVKWSIAQRDEVKITVWVHLLAVESNERQNDLSFIYIASRCEVTIVLSVWRHKGGCNEQF